MDAELGWYHWLAARVNDEATKDLPAFRAGGAYHAQWKAMEAYIVSFLACLVHRMLPDWP